jgi:hypothetical protein
MSNLKEILEEKTHVTSPPKKTNWRDQIVSWVTSAIVTLFALGTSLIGLISQILDSIADYLLPYLQQVPRQDRPLWLALLTFFAMGLVILNKRRISGSDYVPPPAVPPPVVNPAQPSPPAPQGQPLPPGTPPDTTNSAF